MSYQLERKLIETQFKTAMPSGAAIQYGNTSFTPPPAGFTRISVLSGGESALLSLTGGSARRYGGIVDVGIFVPHDAGTNGLRVIADQVEAALAHQSLIEGTVRIVTFGTKFAEIGKAGDWYQGNVTVRFERDAA